MCVYIYTHKFPLTKIVFHGGLIKRVVLLSSCLQTAKLLVTHSLEGLISLLDPGVHSRCS